MTNDLHGVRLEPDGTQRDIIVAAHNLHDTLRRELDGPVEFGHYGTVESAVSLAVHEFSALNGSPVNGPATAFVSALRGEQLSYWLHGSVILFGYDPQRGDLVDLSDEQRTTLSKIPAVGGAA
ncbi:hypothetical protein [Streptomyces sp. NPDC046821]|uniref:hypothetical protein n=1 Tax=Streptomyces sp. NPDC046821 TaxID=3154702 RepID=UPI0033D494E4